MAVAIRTHLFLEGDHLEDDLLGAGEAARGSHGNPVLDFSAYWVLLAHCLLGELCLTLALGLDLHL